MHFVENHALRVLVQKSDRVVFGKAPHVEVLQRVVRQVWKQITDQRRLAGPVGAKQPVDRTSGDCERYVVEGLVPGVLLGDMFYCE